MQRLYLSVLYLVGVLLVEALHLVLAAQRPLDVAQVEGVEGRRGRIADKVAADDVTGLLNSELRMRYCVDVLRGGAEVDRDVYQIKRRLSSSGCVNI